MKHDLETNIVNTFIVDKKKRLSICQEKDFEIPIFSDYKKFAIMNYPVSFLKVVCKFYKLKVSGNKPDLKSRIYDFLLNSNYVLIIQKIIRGYFVRLYHKLIGPALYNRESCMNSTDFLTFQNVSNIPYNEFFSYMSNNSIWGFNILSIYNLFTKSKRPILNPYTREPISNTIFDDIKVFVRLCNLFKKPVNLVLNKPEEHTNRKKIEIKSLELFQYMDELGNYTDSRWFSSLNRVQLIKFIRELVDIWEYRAQLTMEIKKEICHPYGNPFRYIDLIHLGNLAYIPLQKMALSVIEQFIKKGIDRDTCNLGASYVLCGLTLVNNEAALALPWLYQSVSGIA